LLGLRAFSNQREKIVLVFARLPWAGLLSQGASPRRSLSEFGCFRLSFGSIHPKSTFFGTFGASAAGVESAQLAEVQRSRFSEPENVGIIPFSA
jgi:hypothetical protein